MTTIEGNKLISIFVNDRNTVQLLKDIEFDKTQGDDFHLNEQATLETFKYHSSWDCQRPVIEKIHDEW